MDSFYFPVLIAHIVTGYLALMIGAFLMIARKGNKRHKLFGKIYYFSMVGVAATALYMSWYKDIMFLFHISIFVFYQAHSGFMSAKERTLKPGWFDILLLVSATVNGVFMVLSQNVVLMVFGGISLLLVFTDLRIYTRIFRNLEIKKLTWLSRHIGMMVGSYIGAITAFLVVNISVTGIFGVLLWLGPTFILVPLMRYWVWKYTGGKKKVKIEKKFLKFRVKFTLG